MDNELLEKDRAKVGEFLSLAESGALQAGLTPAQKNKINQYIIDQRNIYANAAYAAQSGRVKKSSPDYIAQIQQMNKVKSNLVNLANQQKAIAANQQQYLDDFQSDRISKANYIQEDPNSLVDVYTGKADLGVDEDGNILFKVGDKFKPYIQLADYSLKATDTANKVLNIVEKVNNAKNRISGSSLGVINNNLKSLIEKGGRNTLLSLLQDDLLPGFENANIPKEFYKKENYTQLKDFFLSTMKDIILDINGQLPNPYSKGKDIKKQNLTALTGLDDRSRNAYYNTIVNSPAGQTIVIPNFSAPDDPSPARGYGAYNYNFLKSADGQYNYVATDRKGNIMKKGTFTKAELEEMLLGQAMTPQLDGDSPETATEWTPGN